MTKHAPGKGLAAEVSTDSRRRMADRVTITAFTVAMVVVMLWQGGVNSAALWVLWGLTAVSWFASLAHVPTSASRLTLPWLWLGMGCLYGLQIVPLPRFIVALLHPGALALSDSGRQALGLPLAEFLPLASSPAETAAQGATFMITGSLVALYGHHLMRPNGRRMASHHGTYIGILCIISGLLWGFSYAPWMSKMVPAGLRWTLRDFALINPNHQAGVCVVGIALMMRSVLRSYDLSKRNLYLFGAVLLGGLAFLTGSKGGVLASLFVAIGSLATMRHRWRHSRMAKEELAYRTRIELGLKVSTAGLIVGLALVPFIEAEILPELVVREKINKVELLREASDLIGDGWLLGEGAGALPVLAGVKSVAAAQRMDFMENMVLQRLLDNGLLGAILFFAVLASMLARTVSTMVRGAAGWGPWLAICGLLLQNLADFSIEITFGMLLLLTMSIHVERLHVRSAEEKRVHRSARRYRRRLLIGTAAAICASGVMLSMGSAHWSRGLLSRLSPLSLAEARSQTANHYLHSDFAFLSLCRKAVKTKQFKEALPYCDRAIELRPESSAARLLRLATEIDGGRPTHVQQDLKALLSRPSPQRDEAIELCARFESAERELYRLMPDLEPKVALAVARKLFPKRPDMVERLVFEIRKVKPNQVSPVEALLARIYIQRGHNRAADRIATQLIKNPQTTNAGWEVQAELLLRAKNYDSAFKLFNSVCNERQVSSNACVRALLIAQHAMGYDQTLRYANKAYLRLRQVPEHAYIHWMTLAKLHLDNRRYERAISSARRALGLKRNDPKALVLEAESHLAISDWRAAHRAIKLLPKKGRWAEKAADLAHEVSQTRGGQTY